MARSFWNLCGMRRTVEPVEEVVPEEEEETPIKSEVLPSVGSLPGATIGAHLGQKPFVADFRRKGILSGCEVLDVYSPTWVFVKSTIKKRLTELRKKNDTLTLSERKTHIIRGRIAELEKLLKLPEDDKK